MKDVKVSMSLEEVRSLVGKGSHVALYTEVPSDSETPITLYSKLSSGEKNTFLFESVEGGEKVGRYTFIGGNPAKMMVFHEGSVVEYLRMVDGGLSGRFAEGEGYRVQGLEKVDDSLVVLQRELDLYKVIAVEGLPRFQGGLVGFFTYECVKYFENGLRLKEKPDPVGLPESVFLLIDTLAVFDHVKKKTIFISHLSLEGDVEVQYRQACEKLADLVGQLGRGLVLQPLADGIASLSQAPSPILRSFGASEGSRNDTRQEYGDVVRDAKQKIVDGEIFQIIVSQRVEIVLDESPFALYRRLRMVNPSPYMYFLDIEVPGIGGGLGDSSTRLRLGRNDSISFQIVGASPEAQVRLERGELLQRPLAGTRRRGATDAEDLVLERELLADEKEKAEHMMLVDLTRNDLGKVAEVGSVRVEDLMHVEKYSHVMHLSTDVRARLRAGMNAFDVFKATFPVGTVSGAPKVRAMQLIDGYEDEKRGLYAGAVGYFDFSGNCDFAIAIRTMVCKDGKVFAQAGAGIVFDSVPEREYEECFNKLRGSMRAVGSGI